MKKKKSLIFSLLIVFLVNGLSFSQETTPPEVLAGKKLFNANCAACHKLNKKSVGPALKGVSEKYDREWLYKWVKNSAAVIKSGDAQAVAIWEEYNKSPMTAFPQLSDGDIDTILAYTDYTPPARQGTAQNNTVNANSASIATRTHQLIIVFSLIVFSFLAILFYAVRRFMKKVAIANGIEIIEKKTNPLQSLWQAYIKNQFLLLLTAIFGLLSIVYFGYAYLMQIGVDQGYMPVQPIHYSHKIHAGDNEIECKYCHSSSRVSKHSGIPSLNVCMNCHQNIAEYNGEEDLEKGYTKAFYTEEIKKLYKAVGWDEENQRYTGETQPVKWVRIHNLPDFVYFNHSQHVEVAGVDCQKCHGPVEEMEIMYQYSPLTMGWCIDCHRETNVDLKNNAYYKKIHEELSKKYGVEKLTIAEIGGLECAKCHY